MAPSDSPSNTLPPPVMEIMVPMAEKNTRLERLLSHIDTLRDCLDQANDLKHLSKNSEQYNATTTVRLADVQASILFQVETIGNLEQ